MDTPTNQSHTQLYIIIGLLVIFALLFFTFRIPNDGMTSVSPEDSTPLSLKRLVLTAEQLAARKITLEDPRNQQKNALTKDQIKVKESTALDSRIDAPLVLTEEQKLAREESLKK